MRAIDYIEQFDGNDDELILNLYEEMDELSLIRQVKTIHAMASLFKEVDQKYRKIADSIGLDPDLFEDLVRECDSQIFRRSATMPYLRPEFRTDDFSTS